MPADPSNAELPAAADLEEELLDYEDEEPATAPVADVAPGIRLEEALGAALTHVAASPNPAKPTRVLVTLEIFGN